VDPVTVGAVLAAIVGGVGGGLGGQVWAGLCALVSRPFRHAPDSGGADSRPVGSGATELAALERAPGDQVLGVALAEVLLARAAADGGFADALESWWEQARRIRAGGDTANTISGGTFHGPVLQGRDFSGLSFGSAAPPPAGPSGPGS